MPKGSNMTIDERYIAIGMLQGGATVAEVAAKFERSRSTIHRLYKKFSTTTTAHDRPRSGRPKILSNRQKKIISRAARATPKIRYQKLAKAAVVVQPDGTSSKPPSRSTLYRVLRSQNLSARSIAKN
ncbi:hypothetical protein yc1106_10111 [Curvularia clavata]|uniref:Transposase IS30-like HTH domain-containing protein n=1 Tax=Curvularia clavata TaxID=95742 RepID=A0A9Q9DXD9_CURCL|nr:hypothetical protein yc1106_10111 [Curvularia clavata]